MNIKDLSKPLDIGDVDFRVQSINSGGYATILAYKNARVDQQRLDDVVGPLGWKREHNNGNHNCIVSIWCDDKKQWVSKEDTGTESYTEKEKGLASDSFKRACFNWGIGRELYSYPIIQVKLNKDEYEKDQKTGRFKGTWKLRPNDWEWDSEFADGHIIKLSATIGTDHRFLWVQSQNGVIEPNRNYAGDGSGLKAADTNQLDIMTNHYQQEDSLSLWCMRESLDMEVWGTLRGALSGRISKGNKIKGMKKLDELMKIGEEKVAAYTEAMKSFIANEDKVGLEELKELPDEVKKAIFNDLNEEERLYLKSLKSPAEASES